MLAFNILRASGQMHVSEGFTHKLDRSKLSEAARVHGETVYLSCVDCAPKFVVFLKSTLESIHLYFCQITLTLWNHRRTEEVKESVNPGASSWGLGLALGTTLLLLKLHDKAKHLPAADTRRVG